MPTDDSTTTDGDDEFFEDISTLKGAAEMAADETLPESWREAAAALADQTAAKLREQ